MRSIRERLNRGKLPRVEMPYVDLSDEIAETWGLPVGRYVLLDAVAVAADTWNSDDLRVLWESVSSWVEAGVTA